MDPKGDTRPQRAIPCTRQTGKHAPVPDQGRCNLRARFPPRSGLRCCTVYHVSKRWHLKGRAERASAARTEKGSIEGEGVLYSGIQLLICANKWDKIEHLPAPSKAVLAKALRCVAHAYGCHLLYTACSTQAQGSGQKSQETQKKLRNLLLHMMFAGFERKLCAAQILLHCGTAPMIDLSDEIYCLSTLLTCHR